MRTKSTSVGISPFQVLIFRLRLAYLAVEVIYNITLVHLATSIDTDFDDLDLFVSVGHWLAAIGFTLLIAPSAGRRLPYYITPPLLLITLFGAHHAINRSVDWAIDYLEDSAHEAYYLNLFRLGLAANILDSELIPVPETPTTDFRLALVNVYAALFADPDLVERLYRQARPAARRIMAARGEKHFREMADQLAASVEALNHQHGQLIDLKEWLDQILLEHWQHRNDYLEQTIQALRRRYERDYRPASDKALKRINNAVNDTRLQKQAMYWLPIWIRKYERTKSYPRSYERKMRELFPHMKYVTMDHWCNSLGCPSIASIKAGIKKAGHSNFYAKAKISPGLSFEQFMHARTIKTETVKTLNQRLDTRFTSNDFDYSPKAFSAELAKALKRQQTIDNADINAAAQKHLGLDDPQLYLDWAKMIRHSPVVTDMLSRHFAEPFTQRERNIVLNMIARRNLSYQALYDQVYLPTQTRLVSPYLYSRQDFQQQDDAKAAGRDAIVSMVAPAMGVTLSLLSLLLNTASAVSFFLLNHYRHRTLAGAAWVATLVLMLLPALWSRPADTHLLNRLHQEVDTEHAWVRYHLFLVYKTLHIEEILDYGYHAVTGHPDYIDHHDPFGPHGRL